VARIDEPDQAPFRPAFAQDPTDGTVWVGYSRNRAGFTEAEVVTARPLDAEQTAGLAARLKQVVGNDVEIDVRVDPSLLGGMVVRLGSRMIDSSLRAQLQRLSLSMKGVG
jgi:F-type H+-transporting ATPase subunit delta